MFNSIITFLMTHTPLLYFTQSLWRDEAFSVLVATPGGWETIKLTAADYNPPLYYLTLNLWMKIFGSSEISIRSLSLIFFVCLLFVVFKFSQKLFKGKWPFIATLLFAVNPLLVYYGFEARMYSLYAFLITASMYFFYINKWKPYWLVTTLALYTHPFTVFVPLTQGLYLLINKKLTKQLLLKMLVPFFFYLPWILVIIKQFSRSRDMWIYPVDFNLVTSVLGNLFIGFDGTPWFLWKYTKIISLLMMLVFLIGLRKKANLKKNSLFYLWIFFPLITVLGISFFKPIFVNRYVISVTVAEIFLLLICINRLPSKILRRLLMSFFFSLSVFFLFFLPKYIKKVDIRSTFQAVNKLARKDDLVYAKSPLVFFESTYYFQDKKRVFLYNPDYVRLPGFLGTVLMPPSKNAATFPVFPGRVFMIYENGDYQLFSAFPTHYESGNR